MTHCQLLRFSHFLLGLPKCKGLGAGIRAHAVAPCSSSSERRPEQRPAVNAIQPLPDWERRSPVISQLELGPFNDHYWFFFSGKWSLAILWWLYTAHGVMRVTSAAGLWTGTVTCPLSLMRLKTTGPREKWAAPSAVCYLPTDSSTHLGLSIWGLRCPMGSWVNEG